MAKISNPETFTIHYNVDRDQLLSLGVLDPTLAVDTKLFIDPLLLRHSEHPEFHQHAYDDYCEHFGRVIALLGASQTKEDVPWRNARRHLVFHEINGTCNQVGEAGEADPIVAAVEELFAHEEVLAARLVRVSRHRVRERVPILKRRRGFLSVRLASKTATNPYYCISSQQDP